MCIGDEFIATQHQRQQYSWLPGKCSWHDVVEKMEQ